MKSMIIWVLLMLSPSLQAYVLNDFFIWDDWEQSFIFRLENRQELPIDGMTLFFLQSNDCQSGYMKTYRTSESQIMYLKPEQILSLKTPVIYQLMQDLDVLQAQSILLRLTYQKKHLAEFVGGCEDQGINCCLPVSCQTETKDCVFKTRQIVQPFHFND